MPKKNQQQTSVPRFITLIALAMILTACSLVPKNSETVDITLQPTLSSQAYLDKADSYQGNAQSDWLIMALKAAIKEGDSEQAALLISQLEKQPLSEAQRAEWQMSRAEYLRLRDRIAEALQKLNFPQQWQLSSLQWQNYHRLRTRLFEQNGNYFKAAQELNRLSNYIPLEKREDIAGHIWSNLSRHSESDIRRFSEQQNDPELIPWLELALHMKTEKDISRLQKAIQAWFEMHPSHIAAIYTPTEVAAVLELEIIDPKNSALLLPLSGKFEKQAKLVRDGFLMALTDDQERTADKTLHVIDTNNITTADLIMELQEREIDFIVGPLIKSNIEELSEARSNQGNSLPMLALNIPSQIDSSLNTCYFTLSPEQEVQQAAKYLFEQGFEYPLVLAPKGAVGERVAIAFQNEWKKYSPAPAVVSYFGDKNQIQKDVNRVFGIDASRSRISQMRGLMKRSLENQARSRRDVDAVYMIAKSSELALIKPFIEVILNPEAKPPKLFTNSRSNNGVRRQHEDLGGIVFSDIPMLVKQDVEFDAKLNELWPNQSYGQKRLLALGMDAYQLASELSHMKVFPDYNVEGKTGVLSAGEQCIIQREMSWSEYE